MQLHFPVSLSKFQEEGRGRSVPVRCIIEYWIPARTGSCRILYGNLPAKVKKYIEAIKPEAAYFRSKMSSVP